MNSTCEERAGFLFKHACDRLPAHVCGKCNKSVCNEHSKLNDQNQLICVTCTKQQSKLVRQQGQPGYYDRYDDDPYFYGDRRYRGYGNYSGGYWGGYMIGSMGSSHHHTSYSSGGHTSGESDESSLHDPDDFTEADGGATETEGDADFEQDMGES